MELLLGSVDFDVARVQYELFGDTCAKIAQDHKCPINVIEMARDQDGWSKIEFTGDPSLDIKKLDDFSNVPDDLLDKIRNKQLVIEILKQERLASFYLRAESLLLRKIMMIAEELQPSAANAASQIKSLTDSLKGLMEKTQAIIGARAGEDDGKTSFNITIQQKFGD